MNRLPEPQLHHFSHPKHPLKSVHTNQEFICDGCKTIGTGKRFRCNECDFDLHDYCGMCPSLLFSFMHPHPLTQEPQKTHNIHRVCDICRDPIKGLFYRCKECEFDVHPLCTQLPQKLHHALHNTHPLILQSSSIPTFCGVCRNSCNGWRYRCGICNFDIHLECVLTPVASHLQHQQTSQRVPFHSSARHAPYHDYFPSTGPNFGHNLYQYMYPQQNYQGSGVNGTGQLGRSMFSLVGQLGFGVLSNMIFGVDIPSLFVGSS